MAMDALKCYQKATSKYTPATLQRQQEYDDGEFILCVKVWFKIGKLLAESHQIDQAVRWYESAVTRDIKDEVRLNIS